MKPDETQNFDLERLLVVLRRRWWLIGLITILAAIGAFAVSVTQTKQYVATASVLFEDQQVNQQASGLQATPTSPSQDPQLMATDVQLLTPQSGIAAATARLVGHGVTAAAVSNALTASQQGQTNIANVSVTSAVPSLASAIANTFVAQFISHQRAQQQASVQQGLSLVERQIAALSHQSLAGATGQALLDRAESLRILSKLQDGGVQQVSVATVPKSPSSPKVLRNTLLGFLIGLMLGVAGAFLYERLDRRMKDLDDLEAAYRLPLLAVVPDNKHYGLPPEERAGTHGDTEVFKLLRAYLRYFNVDRELRILMVASASPGDGKSTVAHNLAEAAQETGTKTLLLETDLRRPTFASHYGLQAAPGLSELLIGSVDTSAAIRSVPLGMGVNGAAGDASLDVLVAGHPPPNPAELIESKTMADIVSWAAEEYGLVVIDTPPLGVVSDAMSLLRQVDGVVLISQLGKNTRDSAAFLRQRLTGVSAPLLGVVANRVKTKGKDGYGYGYGYYGADRHAEQPDDELSVR